MTSRQRAHQIRFPERHRARRAVSRAVKNRRLPHPINLVCTDCLKIAEEYDHYLGYEKVHHLDVQPVCIKCHARRFRNERFDHKEIMAPPPKFCKNCFAKLPKGLLVWCSKRCRGYYRYHHEDNYRKIILDSSKRRWLAHIDNTTP